MRAKASLSEDELLAQELITEESEIPSRPREDDPRHEVLGSLVVLMGVFVLASLVAGSDGRSVVGPVGEKIAAALRWFLGSVMAFAIPMGMLWLGVQSFRGVAARWPGLRGFGCVMITAGVAGLLALPGADNPELRQETFARAGALGTFLVEWDGLRLYGQFGALGAVLILAGLLLTGAVLATNLGVSTLATKILRRKPADLEPVPAAAPMREPVTEEEAFEEIAKRPVKESWLQRFFFFGGTKSRRASLLTDLPEEGWNEEPADRDVAAVARALEAAELEAQASKSLRVSRSGRFAEIEEVEEYSDDQPTAEEEAEDVEEYCEESEDQEIPGEDPEEAAEEHEIIFKDHSGPLVTKPNVGEGLAKLFPTRWPKEGEPSTDLKKKKETAAEVMDKAEARMLRQTADAPAEDDPLFDERIDARPHGPAVNGAAPAAEIGAPAYNLEDYVMPPLDVLADPPVVDARMTREEVLETSSILTNTLKDFGIDGRVTEVHQGPVVTRFEFKPAAGIKVSRITGLENDIAMGMRATSVRILAPIPGKDVVGIEVPNKKRQGVYLKELVAHQDFWDESRALSCALGKTIDGSPFYCDLARMPHLLIAGATGAGKSVCLNTIICSLLLKMRPDQVRLIMVDPKRVELSIYSDIPHLLAPVVCEAKCAATALEWAVEQMEERYKKLVQFGVRNIDGYNKLVKDGSNNKRTAGKKLDHMPYMVIIVDELADLMLVARAEVEESIQRLAQMARAVGIHLILATQRPSVNVITGIIKANFPSRIAFQVSQKVDSRTILDHNGAECLLGRGDMLFAAGGAGKAIRVQGAFVSDEEVERIAEFSKQIPVQYEIEEFEAKLTEKEQRELAKMMGVEDPTDLEAQDRIVRGTNKVMGKVTAGMFIPHEGGSARAGDEEIDEALVRAAARLIMEARVASVSMIQRRLKVGFARAGRMMDMLHEMGLVGEFKGSKPRDILVDPEAAIEQLDKLEAALAAGYSAEQIKAREDQGIAIDESEAESDEELEEDSSDESDVSDESDESDEEYEDEEDDEETEDIEGIGDPNKPWPKKK